MNERYYLSYYLDGNYYETDELYNHSQAIIEKGILEDDGCVKVELHQHKSVLF